MASNPITAINEVEKKVINLEGLLNNINSSLLDISKTARKTGDGFLDIKLPKELEQQLKNSKVLNKDLNDALKNQENIVSQLRKEVDALKKARTGGNKPLSDEEKLLKKVSNAERLNSESKTKLGRKLQRIRQETAKTNRETKSLTTEYGKLRLKLSKAENEFRRLSITEGETARSTIAMRKEAQRLRRQVDALNKPIKRLGDNVGNYPKRFNLGIGALKGLIGAFSLWQGLRIAKQIFEEAKQLDSLSKALQQVTGDSESYAEAQEFISERSEAYGVEIKSLTKEYTNFLGALKGTSLEGEKGNRIFDRVIKTTAVLGKSADETSGILNAFTQIISKGKVQAEELRGQLGDRLPGALNIMARALDVPLEKLNKMLEDGDLIAEEVLPKFAVELEKTFGADTVNRVDTLEASQNRLNNAYLRFVSILFSSDGLLTKVISGTLSFITDLLNSISQVSEEIKEIFKTDAQEAAEKAQKKINDAYSETKKQLQAVRDAQQRLFLSEKNREINLKNRAKLVKAIAIAEGRLSTLESKSFANRTAQDNQEIIITQKRIENTKDEIRLIDQKIKAFEEVSKAIADQDLKEEKSDKKKKEKKPEKVFKKGTIAFFQQQIAKLKELAEQTSLTTDEFESFEKKILDIQKKINILRGDFPSNDELFPDIEDAFNFLDAQQDLVDDLDILKNVLAKELSNISDELSEEEIRLSLDTAETEEEVQKLGEKLKNIYTGLAKDRESVEKELQANLVDLRDSAINTVVDLEQERYDERITENNNYYDSLLRNEELSDEQRAALEEERTIKNIELEKKKAAVEKKALLFSNTIRLAEIAADTVKKVAAIKATAAVLNANPATIAAGGLALSQIPFVIGSAAAASGAILAQTIPAFEKGKDESNNYSGLAIWGEKRREVKYNPKTGSIEVSPDRASLTNVEEEDIIFKSISHAKNALNSTKMASHALSSPFRNGEITDTSIQMHMLRLILNQKSSISKDIKEGFEKSKINNNINLPSNDISHLLWKNSRVNV